MYDISSKDLSAVSQRQRPGSEVVTENEMSFVPTGRTSLGGCGEEMGLGCTTTGPTVMAG